LRLLRAAFTMLGWFVPALGLASQQYPNAMQPSVNLEGTMSSAQPLETDVWADPAPAPKSLSMSTTGPGIHSPEWKVGATEGSRKGGPGLDVFDVPTDECGVSVYRNEDGRLEMFAVGPDDQIYHKAQKQTRKPEQWTDWMNLGGPTRSGPAVARDPLGRLFLVVMFPDGSYRFRSQRSRPMAGEAPHDQPAMGMSNWTKLGGKFASKPEVIRDSEGFLHVFGRGLDQQLYHRYQMAYPDGARTRVSWDKWVHMGGPASSAPSVLLDHESMLNVFIRGGDRQLWRVRQARLRPPPVALPAPPVPPSPSPPPPSPPSTFSTHIHTHPPACHTLAQLHTASHSDKQDAHPARPAPPGLGPGREEHRALGRVGGFGRRARLGAARLQLALITLARDRCHPRRGQVHVDAAADVLAQVR
jgi:hypothetical protein